MVGKKAAKEPVSQEFKWEYPNMILIAGDGRNVGKTTLARKIITSLSDSNRIIAIKSTPHFHPLSEDQLIIAQKPDYIVAEEKAVSDKDSSLFLQAGAAKVYFIMAGQEHLDAAFSVIAGDLNDSLIVAESGGLNAYVRPGVFLFVKFKDETIRKKEYLRYNPRIVNNTEWNFDFAAECLEYTGGELIINAEET